MALQDLLDKAKTSLFDNDDPEELPDVETDDILDEDYLPADPKPSRVTAKPAKSPKRTATPTKVTVAKKKEIKDFLILMITMPSATLSMKDPHCAGAFLDNAENIADALVPLICRNPAMLAWFTTGTGMFDYFILLQALQPVATTIYKHHISKSIDHEHGEDQYDDYSQFSAPRFG